MGRRRSSRPSLWGGGREGFGAGHYLLFGLGAAAVFLLCVCVGSVNLPLMETVRVLLGAGEGSSRSILLQVRLPRVLCAAITGAGLSLCGGAMQGLLRNPLADGSTLGVSSGASLGAVLAIALGVRLPVPGGGTMLFAIAFAFGSLALILTLAYRLDRSLATNTIILIGIIYSMFASAMISLVITFSGEKMQSIIFWTMGSLAGCTYLSAATAAAALLLCGAVILGFRRELNAFAIGEDNARNVGINVKRVKLAVMIAVSVLIGVCVSIGGTISFVGLVMPHITRMVTGPNHGRLLPATLFSGAVFLMLADLVARVAASPLELPIGVVTSLVGAVVFVYIYSVSAGSRRGR